jgi:hypothetical protein
MSIKMRFFFVWHFYCSFPGIKKKDSGFWAPNGAVKNKLLLGVRISIYIPPLFLKYHIAVGRDIY